jgi:hypothetical protein
MNRLLNRSNSRVAAVPRTRGAEPNIPGCTTNIKRYIQWYLGEIR